MSELDRPPPCGKGFCEANAFYIEIRKLKSQLEQKDEEINSQAEYAESLIRFIDELKESNKVLEKELTNSKLYAERLENQIKGEPDY